MIEIKNDHNESYFSNLLFSRKNNFQKGQFAILHHKLTVNFENALSLSANCNSFSSCLVIGAPFM